MKAFATTVDLQARWRTLTEDELAMAEVELQDASAFIAGEMRRYDVAIDPSDEVQSQNIVRVTCEVVRRSMSPRLDASEGTPLAPFTESTITADVFTESYKYANPLGDYYLTAADKQSLGIGRMRVRQWQVKIGGSDEG